ncbi:hypothetical protein O9Z70_03685 [Devosia sp. YIM 151766]|uniref:hypothetical protein n=1 Tax=Devosia sp. YIM 151766 TaxID=3017325 RepID=UPI00255CC729|nr:hypothetical protein [Devosia sp. YIM 151766]WIY53652.1 hypothetical protein O9Z70_03685 [Devosia sp. YIM 151766]
MGKLLRFAAREKSTDDGTTRSGDAQILLFTGVRYERGTPPPTKTDAEAKRRKRKRV